MIFLVLFYLFASIYLYCLLAGADFGAGVLEVISPYRSRQMQEEKTTEAIGPVWEANHIWLIIVIVILFNGFPKAYAIISVYLHLPLFLMLMGIVLRGCAFVFRHYDPIRDESHRYYSWIFSWASILTPIMLGVIIGSLMLGRISTEAEGYFLAYVAPWLNLFSFSVGLFILCIFVFIASTFLIGESTNKDFKDHFMKTSKISLMAMVMVGGLVFLAAEADGFHLYKVFLGHPLSLGCLVIATLALFGTWKSLSKASVWLSRILAGLELLMVILAWLAVVSPHFLFFKNGQALSFVSAAAPILPLQILGWSLVAGSIFFFPALFYLFRIFKR